MIVITDAQIFACTILVLVFITILAEVQNGGYGVTHIVCPVHQIGTALVEYHIALGNILQRLHNAPVRVQRVLRHLVGVTLTIGCEHVLA